MDKITEAGGPLNIKTPSYQYRNSHCKDKTVSRPSYLYNDSPILRKTVFIYWNEDQLLWSCTLVDVLKCPALVRGAVILPGDHFSSVLVFGFVDVDALRMVVSIENSIAGFLPLTTWYVRVILVNPQNVVCQKQTKIKTIYLQQFNEWGRKYLPSNL